jgi:hypothetical protein
MATHAKERSRSRKRELALTASVIAAVAVTGCGGSTSPAAVHLTLTAPTDGSVVEVAKIRVFGKVDPPSAVVDVAGRRARTTHGDFARWMVLRAGLSRIKLVASADGFLPTHMDISVRSTPPRHHVSASSGSGTVSSAANPGPPPAGNAYSSTVRATLLRACQAIAGGTPTAAVGCECYLRHLEAHVSERAIEVWERAFLKGEARLPAWAREAASACRRA